MKRINTFIFFGAIVASICMGIQASDYDLNDYMIYLRSETDTELVTFSPAFFDTKHPLQSSFLSTHKDAFEHEQPIIVRGSRAELTVLSLLFEAQSSGEARDVSEQNIMNKIFPQKLSLRTLITEQTPALSFWRVVTQFDVAAIEKLVLSLFVRRLDPDITEENITEMGHFQIAPDHKDFLERIAKTYFYTTKENDASGDRKPLELPFAYGFSIKELSKQGKFPRLDDSGHLNLSNLRVNSLDGLESIELRSKEGQSLPYAAVASIDLSGNLLQEFPQISPFKEYTGLNILDLSNNHLADIPAGFFTCCMRLTELKLSDNQIQAVTKDLFEKLPQLQVLDLRQNKIKRIENGTWPLCQKVRILLLGRNWITDIKDSFNEALPALEILDLSNNNIRVVPDGAFRSLGNLRELDLSATILGPKYIKPLALISRLLQGLQTPDNVTVAPKHQRITALEGQPFVGLDNLKVLKLSGNLIPELRPGVFAGLKSLETLELQRTGIKELLPGVLEDLGQVKSITLSNQCSVRHDPNLDIVDTANIATSRNELDDLLNGALDRLSELTMLDMSAVAIKLLMPGVFRKLPALKKLVLSPNRINNFRRDLLDGIPADAQIELPEISTLEEIEFIVEGADRA